MRILFLDQSGHLGGAELCLLDIARPYGDSCRVALFSAGPFQQRLSAADIPVSVLAQQGIQVRKEGGLTQGFSSLGQLVPLIRQVSSLARSYDLIYANTPKALIVGAIASLLSHRPLVYHLHDIISPAHFSKTNRTLLITLANRFAAQVIANSAASQAAFISAGGNPALCSVVYNGFQPDAYQIPTAESNQLKAELGVENQFLIGHFSRLSPWKGQHVLIEALAHCPEDVTALLVGDALFGEQDYVQQLHDQVERSGLRSRVKFLGFRTDIPQVMSACDLVVHSSTAPEPFGRVIVEAMLCGTPVIAAAAGGATELVDDGKTGWLCPPEQPQQLAKIILNCCHSPQRQQAMARSAQTYAREKFDLDNVNQQLGTLLSYQTNPDKH
ncbi:MAG: glycosyltransferase family 4 protein [Phormidesmis sp.]